MMCVRSLINVSLTAKRTVVLFICLKSYEVERTLASEIKMKIVNIFLFLSCCLVILPKDEVSAYPRIKKDHGITITFARNETTIQRRNTSLVRSTIDDNFDHAWLHDENDNSTTPRKVKPEKKPGGYLSYDKEGDIEILKKEGEPGWMEKLVEEAKKARAAKKQGKKPKHHSHKRTRFGEELYNADDEKEKFPMLAYTKLSDNFNQIGKKANGALAGLKKMKQRWVNKGEFGDRSVYVAALQSAASNIGKFANAADDPKGAMLAALAMVTQFASLAGPMGEMASIALSFVAGFLSLFGVKQKKKKTVGEIVREEIEAAFEKFDEKRLIRDAKGIIKLYDVSKTYVDSLSQSGKKLSVDQAIVMNSAIPLWQGVHMMKILAEEIPELVKKNKAENAKKVLRYIDLYVKMALLKDMILQQAAALMPDELSPNRDAMLDVQATLRVYQSNLIEFLYESDVGSETMRYYDPNLYPLIDAYAITTLKIPNFDRSLAGVWCITPHLGGKPLTSMSWAREHSQLKLHGHPYATLSNDGCFWKLIPHGKYLYTIQNVYGCPKYDHCGEYLSSDGTGSNHANRVTVEPYPDLWEIHGSRQKRIRTKWGCAEGSSWCNMQLGPQYEDISEWGDIYEDFDPEFALTMGLTKANVGYIWYITRNPKQQRN